ncbi:MAG: CHASE2 domain-containing protein, partial [Pseudomonadota bacterium]
MAQRRNWIATAPLVGGLVVLATIALLTLGGASNRSGGLRAALFDLYGRLAPIDAPATSQFHIVEIDDESLARVGPWPWPRSELAKVVDGVADAGAKGIVLAVPVDTPDPLTPSTIGAFWLEGARDEGLARELSKLPNTDAVLGDALKRVSSSVVINPGAAADLSRRLEPGSSKIVNTKQFSVLGQTESGRSSLPTSTTISAPLALSRGGGVAPEVTASSAVSVAALPADDDGILRAPPIVWSYDDALVPSAAFAAAAIIAGKGQPVAIADPTATSDAGRIVQSVSLSTDGKGIPVDRTGRAIIGWPKKLSVQSTSAARLYDQSTGSNAQLADKVVLIGLGDRLGKIVTTPIGEISALRAHAEVANRLAAGAVLVRPSWSGYLEAGLAMLLGGAAMAWSQTLGGWRSLLLTLFVAAVALAASAFAYTSQALLIDPLPGIVAALLGTFAVTGGRSLAETVGDEKLRGNFRGSLPESTVKALTEEDASSLLKGDYR